MRESNLEKLTREEVVKRLAEIDECLMHSYKYHPMYVKPLERLRNKFRNEYHFRNERGY